MTKILDLVAVHVHAYGRHFFRSAPWVTIMCTVVGMLMLFVPQASELVLAQATYPDAPNGVRVFWARMLSLTGATTVLALSFWLSARLLIATVWRDRGGLSVHVSRVELEDGIRHGRIQASLVHPPLSRGDRMDVLASLYVPRQLGLLVFFVLQLAAASSISEQGYFTPIALVLVWICLLGLLLMRISGVEGPDLMPWWLGILFATVAYAIGATLADLDWIHGRAATVAWKDQQAHDVQTMGAVAVAVSLGFLACTRFALSRTASWVRLALFAATGLAVVVIAFGQADQFQASDRFSFFFVLQSFAATAFWVLVACRRRFRAYVSGKFRAEHPVSRILAWVTDHMTLVAGTGVGGLTATLIILSAFRPIAVGETLGAVSLVLLFCASLTLFVAVLQAALSRTSWSAVIPGGTVAILIFGWFLVWATPPQPPFQESSGAAQWATRAPPSKQTPDPGLSFAIAAHGGGIRAALYSASFAAWLDYYSGRSFSRDLLAGSGASGGSVGLAVWAAVTEAGCFDRPPVGSEKLPACVEAVNEVLTEDHLAPVIATGLFRDYPMFWRSPERGNTLQRSLLHATRALSADWSLGAYSILQGPLAHPGLPLILNATEAVSAMPLAFLTRQELLSANPQPSDSRGSFVPWVSARSLSLLSAAIDSARFPFISPKATVCGSLGDSCVKTQKTVVDGGYFDNSGIAVLREAILARAAATDGALPDLRNRLVVISLDNEPIPAKTPPVAGASLNSIQEILGTVFSARAAHGYAAWFQLCHEMKPENMFSTRPGAPWVTGCEWPRDDRRDDSRSENAPLWLEQLAAHGPALGWYLSPRSARLITKDAQLKAYTLAEKTGVLRVMEDTGRASIQRAPQSALVPLRLR